MVLYGMAAPLQTSHHLVVYLRSSSAGVDYKKNKGKVSTPHTRVNKSCVVASQWGWCTATLPYTPPHHSSMHWSLPSCLRQVTSACSKLVLASNSLCFGDGEKGREGVSRGSGHVCVAVSLLCFVLCVLCALMCIALGLGLLHVCLTACLCNACQ